MKTHKAITVEITTKDGAIYRATSLTNGTVSIERQESGRWMWVGSGQWDGSQVVDCAAVLGDEVYEQLDDALGQAIS